MNGNIHSDSPPNLDAHVRPAFWDRLARKYAERPVPDAESYERWVARVRTHLAPTDRVLEIGCGSGTTALKLADCTGPILATDVSSEMVQIGKEKAAAAAIDNVTFARATLSDASLPVGGFDVVMAFNLVHLLADVPSAFRRISSLLGPRGLFISKTPLLGDQSWVLRAVIPVLRVVGQAPFVNFVSEESLKAALEQTNFALIEEGHYPKQGKGLLLVARKR